MLKFPYGLADFRKLIKDGYFYVDRSAYIRTLEDAGLQLLFLRPRRFGKSLLLSMLENYYDIARTDEFEQLFGHLAIGKAPTALHNQYFVMRWDFSSVLGIGTIEQIKQAIFDHINDQIKEFSLRYAKNLHNAIEINHENALSSFHNLVAAVNQTPHKLYLFIDEYDNFANDVLMSSQHEGRKRYEELVQGDGIFRGVFKNIKAASGSGGLDRVFITGVSPLVMGDISSGYNVATNIYRDALLDSVCGFTEAEITDAAAHIAHDCGFTDAQLTDAINAMRDYYNGYRFGAPSGQSIYNPTLALYFLQAWQRHCAYPDEMLDYNLAMDRARIEYIARLGEVRELLTAVLDESTPLIVTTLVQRFGIKDILDEGPKSLEYVAALLYYFGVLTLDGMSALRKLKLRIPNMVTRELYVEKLRELYLPVMRDQTDALRAAETFYISGNLQPLCDFAEHKLFATFDNRDYAAANELTIKTAFLTLLFNDRLFIVDSETAIRRTYADIVLMRRHDLRNEPGLLDLIVEFKYVRLNQVGLDGAAARAMSIAELHQLPAVQAKFAEAKTQLLGYQSALTTKYGDVLKLRTFAIVAVGFERMLWAVGQ